VFLAAADPSGLVKLLTETHHSKNIIFGLKTYPQALFRLKKYTHHEFFFSAVINVL
jgi:hypothetical protein